MANFGNAPHDIDDIQDLWYALAEAGLLSGTLQDDVIADDAFKTRGYGLQPDGDLVGDMATGEVFTETNQLAGNETYTSDWYDTDGFQSIEVYLSSDQTSLVEGVELQFTDDVQATSPDVKSRTRYTYDQTAVDRGFKYLKSETNLDGFRLVYNNNGTPTSDLMIVATLKSATSLSGADYVGRNVLGNSEVRVGTDQNGTGIKIGDPSSLFGDIVTVDRRTVIDISSTFGTSILRDEISSTGSAAVTGDPDSTTGEIVVSTGTTANSSINIRTAEYGRYVPGYSAQQGIGIRVPTLPTEGEARWGYFDDNNGFYWGYDGDQEELFIARRKDGSDVERVYESNFNRNSIEGVLDREWDVSQGDIFQIDFSWYGYGVILFTVVSQTKDDLSTIEPRQDSVVVHALTVQNETSTADPNEPISVEVENGDAGEDIELRIGGRQFSVFGEQGSERRVTAETRTGVAIADGAWTHMMSWTRNDPTNDANSKLNIGGFDFSSDQTMRVALVVNADVSGTTYNNPSLTPTEETLLGVSTAGTFNGIGNGTKVWEGHIDVGGTGNAQSSIDANVDVRFGQNTVLSMLAWGVGGTGNATTTMRMAEDW